MKTTNASEKFAKAVKILYIIGGAVGLTASFLLTIDLIYLLKNPDAVLPCNVNPIVSCGSVMKTEQSSVFGFANPLLGVIGFAVILTVGMAMHAGAKFKAWFWRGAWVGTLFGLGFVHWLFYQSVYTIGTLCPFCMVVWTVVVPMFWYTTLYVFNAGHLKGGGRFKQLVTFATKHHLEILVVWYAAMIGLILARFWYYFAG